MILKKDRLVFGMLLLPLEQIFQSVGGDHAVSAMRIGSE